MSEPLSRMISGASICSGAEQHERALSWRKTQPRNAVAAGTAPESRGRTMTVPAGGLLWAPPLDGTTAIERFGAAHGYTDHRTLWDLSVNAPAGFCAAVWDWFGVLGTYDRVLSSHEMPGARW